MIRFGELSTKGKNKKDFINTLYKNIKHALKHFETLEYENFYDHIYVVVHEENVDEIVERLKNVSGIHAISLVHSCAKDIDTIVNDSFEIISKEEGETFKIGCKRSDKKFPLVSDQIIRIVATKVLQNLDLKVDVHNPDIMLNIEIRDKAAYIFTKTIKCSGGYPLGTGRKILMMLSGGIDSPVASYLLIKRGIKIDCIHYASPPYTNIGVIEKLKDILHELNTYQADIRLFVVPFTKIQEKIYEVCAEGYPITVMRRMMYRIAEKVAKQYSIPAIANGESLGQVASQTLDSINTINAVTNMPVIRPLATYDKLDIIEIAKKINTYDISIRPYEDCCTIFAPKNPKTRPFIDLCEKYESKENFDEMIDEAVANIETIYISDED